jgi:ribokinase
LQLPKIWSYGFINLDVITQGVDAWPDKNGLVWVQNIDFKPGGVALNPAVTIAKLGGVPVGIIGCIGQDLVGQLICTELTNLGVDITQLDLDETQTSGICIVCVHPDGERSFLIGAGANANLNTRPLRIKGLAAGDYFHLAGIAALTQLQDVLEQVRRQRVTISLDLSFDNSGQMWSRLAPWLPAVNICMANADEARWLTGTTDPTRAVRKISAAGPDTVVIKLGRDGAYISAPTWQGHVEAFTVEAIDTTGAGDGFAGAFLYGLARDWAVEQVAIFASAVGALCTTQAGATEGIQTYAQTIAFIKEQGRAGNWDWSWEINL